MSTILEALEKARRERAEAQYTGHSILNAAPPLPNQQMRRRTRIATVVLFTGVTSLVLILLVAGALVFFYQRLGTLAHQMAANPPSAQPPMRTYVAGGGIVQSGGSAPAVAASPASPVREAELPPPVPIQEVLAAQRDQAARATPEARVATLPDVSASRKDVESQPVVDAPAPALTAAQGKAEKEPSLDGFTLGAILYDPKVPMAVVNGMTVREGMVYDDFRVLRITPNSVVVQRSGRPPVTLRMQR